MARVVQSEGVALATCFPSPPPPEASPGAGSWEQQEPPRGAEGGGTKASRPSLRAELAARTAWPSLIAAVIALAVTVAVQRACTAPLPRGGYLRVRFGAARASREAARG